MQTEVVHDRKDQKFYAIIEGKEAYLRYLIFYENVMDMIKTYVPNELRGRGIAGVIVEQGLKFALENNFRVIPSCSYVDTYIERHPAYKTLLTE